MRHLALAVMASLALCRIAPAQERTLLGRGVPSGGFGGPVVKLTEVADEFGVMVGGRGGWILGHTVVLGGAAYGLVEPTYLLALTGGPRIDLGYGGLEVELVIGSNSLLHCTVQALVGGGGVRLAYGPWDGLAVVEPQVNLELNVTRYLRIAVGGGYRWVFDADLYELTNGDLSAPQGALTVKFGRF